MLFRYMIVVYTPILSFVWLCAVCCVCCALCAVCCVLSVCCDVMLLLCAATMVRFLPIITVHACHSRRVVVVCLCTTARALKVLPCTSSTHKNEEIDALGEVKDE